MVLSRRQRDFVHCLQPTPFQPAKIIQEVCTAPDKSKTTSGEDQPSETTQLLRAWADGDRGALERLTPRVYRTLRRIAGYQMQHERAGQSMQATAPVHAACL